MLPRGCVRILSGAVWVEAWDSREAVKAEAHRLARKVEIGHTPKHGSWSNMAEIEFSALARQCLERRFLDHATFVQEVAVWTVARIVPSRLFTGGSPPQTPAASWLRSTQTLESDRGLEQISNEFTWALRSCHSQVESPLTVRANKGAPENELR